MNLLTMLLAAGVCSQAPPPNVSASGVDLRCGEYCLALSLNALGIANPTSAELEARLGQPSSMGYSMKQLAEVAESYGAYTLGVDTTLDHLGRRDRPFVCIALDEKIGHFFCISDVDQQSVQVVDPPNQRTVNRDAFSLLWDGRALLISDRPISPAVPGAVPAWLVVAGVSFVLLAAALFGIWLLARRRRLRADLIVIILVSTTVTVAGCGTSPSQESGATRGPSRVDRPLIQIDPKVIDLGLMDFRIGAQLSGRFTVRNLGTAPLRLFEANVSCGCTVGDRIPSLMQSGESSTVDFKVKPRNSSGLQGSSILLKSDDPVSPAVRLELRWRERYALTLEPSHLDFGWVARDRDAEMTVEIRIVPELASETFEASSMSPSVKTAWNAGTGPVGQDGLTRRTLKVRLEGGREPGEATTTLIIRDPLSTYKTSLPVRWNSGPPIYVAPKAFYHSGIRPKSDVSNRLIVRSAVGAEVRVARMTVDGKEYPTADQPAGKAAEPPVITAVVRSGAVPGIEHHTIQVYVDGFADEPLTVPVTLVVD